MIFKKCSSCGRLLPADRICNCWESKLEIKDAPSQKEVQGGDKK